MSGQNYREQRDEGNGDFIIPSGQVACPVEASHLPSWDLLTKCSLSQHILLGLCYGPDTLLGAKARDTSENKKDKKP